MSRASHTQPAPAAPVDWDRMLADRLELFFGQATASQCRVYARLDVPALPADVHLAGTLSGPECCWAATLPATSRLNQRGDAGPPLAEALVSDPCAWTPELPHVYSAQLELRQHNRPLASVRRLLGIRTLATAGRSLVFDRRRWVLRGVLGSELPRTDCDALHAAEAALLVDEPHEELCATASEMGVLLVARLRGEPTELADRLRRLSRWPAVGIAILPLTTEGTFNPRRHAPNLLAAQWIAANEPVQLAPWADVAICELESAFDEATRLAACPLPIIALRPAGNHQDAASARVLCDHLQRDLAGRLDAAGLVV